MPLTRERRFTFVVNEDEHAKLMAVAAAERRTAGDWLRLAIDAAYRERFGDKKPKKPRER